MSAKKCQEMEHEEQEGFPVLVLNDLWRKVIIDANPLDPLVLTRFEWDTTLKNLRIDLSDDQRQKLFNLIKNDHDASTNIKDAVYSDHDIIKS